MEQYINKSALVAEIKGLIRENELYLSESYTDEIRFQKVGAYSVLNDLLHFLNTLETKEVDLEKEIGKYLDANDIEFSHQIKLLDFARYFFELGLRIHIPIIYKPTETDVYKLGLKTRKG